MKKLVIQALEVLLRLLVHQPKPVVIQTIIDHIQQELKAGEKELSWALIRKSLDKIVGDNWDTALLLLPFVDPGLKQIRTNFEKARELLGSQLDLLVIPEERTAVENAYGLSDLKTLLRTKGSKLEDIIKAREQFLRNCLHTLTMDVFEPNKMSYYNRARRGLYVTIIGNGKEDVAAECYQNAYVKVAGRFAQVRPRLYREYFIKAMRTDLIERQIKEPVLVPIDVDDNGEPIFEVPASERYNPETAAKEAEAVLARLQAAKTAGTTLLKQQALLKKKVRRLYIFFYLLSTDPNRPAYKEIADKFGVSMESINKDVADVRGVIAETFENYGLGVPANALFSKR